MILVRWNIIYRTYAIDPILITVDVGTVLVRNARPISGLLFVQIVVMEADMLVLFAVSLSPICTIGKYVESKNLLTKIDHIVLLADWRRDV